MQIGEIVFKKVCAQLAQSRNAGLFIIPVPINVSLRQLIDTHLQVLFGRTVVTHGIDPEW